MATCGNNNGSGAGAGGGDGSANLPDADAAHGHGQGHVHHAGCLHHQAATPKTALGCKEEGNKLLRDNQFVSAIKMYSAGLDIAHQDFALRRELNVQLMVHLLCNRAAAYLAFGCYSKALEDADSVLRLDARCAKGISRKVKALCGLARFADSIAFLNTCEEAELNTDNEALVGLRAETNVRHDQNANGNYDLLKLYKAGQVYHADFSDFTGPVKIGQSPGKGRGLFATAEILPGQLVLASKALALVIFGASDVGNQRASNLANHQLCQMIYAKLHLESNLVEVVNDLYAGPKYENVPTVTVGVVDVHRNQQLWTWAFKLTEAETRPEFLVGGKDCYGVGLWGLPTYINHSCWDSNCVKQTLGDLWFVRAFKKISPGEEILAGYCCPSQSFKNRATAMHMSMRVECDCSLCRLDRDSQSSSSDAGKKRAQILENLENSLAKHMKDVGGNEPQLLESLDEFEKLELEFDGSESRTQAMDNPYPPAVQVLIDLAHINFGRYFGRSEEERGPPARGAGLEDMRKAIGYLKKSHAMSVGTPLVRLALESSKAINFALVNLGDEVEESSERTEKPEWAKKLAVDLLIFRGSLDMVSKDAPGLEHVVAEFKGLGLEQIMGQGHSQGQSSSST